MNQDQSPEGQSSNHQLHQYLHQMQMEVGQSGKTLHQVISEFLELEQKFPVLVKKLQEFVISDVDQLSQEQFQKHCDVLVRLNSLRTQVLEGYSTLNDHPWKAFTHPEHRSDDTEALLRGIRFVLIQLSKFWVEVQSFPLFLNDQNPVSIQEIETFFQWLKTCGDWKNAIVQPRVVPAMAHQESRELLLDFMRDVRCARALQVKLAAQMSAEISSKEQLANAMALLTEAIELTQKCDLATAAKADLILRVNQSAARVEQVKQVRSFFQRVKTEAGFVETRSVLEARQFFEAIACVRAIPQAILPWRLPKVLLASQGARIQQWKEQAQPLLQARTELQAWFQLDRPIESSTLKSLSQQLSSGGILRAFKRSYREAERVYQTLLRPEHQSDSKSHRESPAGMAEKLMSWAKYLDQLQAFEGSAEVQSVFDELFYGIDTDFDLALEANLWAAQVRSQLRVQESLFSQQLAEAIFSASSEQIQVLLSLCEDLGSDVQNALLGSSVFSPEMDFAEVSRQEEIQLADYQRLMAISIHLGLLSDVLFRQFDAMKEMLGEIAFLKGRMEACVVLKQWLRTYYRGVDTDLSILEKCLSYVQFIERSTLPQSIKSTFLTLHGPLRLEETRNLMITAIPSLSALKDHLEKLNALTQNQSKDLVDDSIPRVLTQIQLALKNPVLLPNWVEYLKCEKEMQGQGLEAFLHFVDGVNQQGVGLETLYQMVYLASLLRKTVGSSESKSMSRISQSFSPNVIH